MRAHRRLADLPAPPPHPRVLAAATPCPRRSPRPRLRPRQTSPCHGPTTTTCQAHTRSRPRSLPPTACLASLSLPRWSRMTPSSRLCACSGTEFPRNSSADSPPASTGTPSQIPTRMRPRHLQAPTALPASSPSSEFPQARLPPGCCLPHKPPAVPSLPRGCPQLCPRGLCAPAKLLHAPSRHRQLPQPPRFPTFVGAPPPRAAPPMTLLSCFRIEPDSALHSAPRLPKLDGLLL